MASGSSSGNYDSGWRLEDAFVAMTVDAGESPARTPGQQKCRTRLASSDSDEECNALQEQEVSAHRINEIGRATNTGSDGESSGLADTGARQTTQKKKRKNHRGGRKKKGKRTWSPLDRLMQRPKIGAKLEVQLLLAKDKAQSNLPVSVLRRVFPNRTFLEKSNIKGYDTVGQCDCAELHTQNGTT